MTMATVPEAIADFKAGKFVIVVDDEDRENEGDLVVAAELVTAEHISFMTRPRSGLVCIPGTARPPHQRGIPPVRGRNTHPPRSTRSPLAPSATKIAPRGESKPPSGLAKKIL